MTARPRPSGGFTLLEVLVVISLLALTLTLVAPRLASVLPGVQARGAVQDIAAAMRSARERALTENRVVDVSVDAAAQRLDAGGEPSRSLPSGVALQLEDPEADTWTVRFYPDGSSSGGRVALQAGARRYALEVDWLTAAVRVEENPDGVR